MPHARARGGPGPPVTLLLSAWRWNGRLTGRGPNRYVAIGASCPCLGRCCRRDRPRSNCSCRSGVTLRLSFHWALPLGFPSLRRDRQSLSHDRLGRRSALAQPTDCLAARSRGLQNTSSRVLSSHPDGLSGGELRPSSRWSVPGAALDTNLRGRAWFLSRAWCDSDL